MIVTVPLPSVTARCADDRPPSLLPIPLELVRLSEVRTTCIHPPSRPHPIEIGTSERVAWRRTRQTTTLGGILLQSLRAQVRLGVQCAMPVREVRPEVLFEQPKHC